MAGDVAHGRGLVWHAQSPGFLSQYCKSQVQCPTCHQGHCWLDVEFHSPSHSLVASGQQDTILSISNIKHFGFSSPCFGEHMPHGSVIKKKSKEHVLGGTSPEEDVKDCSQRVTKNVLKA